MRTRPGSAGAAEAIDGEDWAGAVPGNSERPQVHLWQPPRMENARDPLPELRQDKACRLMGDGTPARKADGHHQLAPQASLRVRKQGKQRMADGNAAQIGVLFSSILKKIRLAKSFSEAS